MPKIIILPISILFASICWLVIDFGPANWLTLIQDWHTAFSEQYQRHPITVTGSFFFLFTLTAALALPGASLMMLIAGACFGLFWGTIFSLLASTAGATLSMLAARHFLRGPATRHFGPRLAEFNAGMAREGALYLFGLRMAPIIPFIILNPLVGLSSMRTWTFFWISALGMLLGTAAYVNAGSELLRLNSTASIMSPSFVLALALLGVMPLLAKRLVQARLAKSEPRSLPESDN